MIRLLREMVIGSTQRRNALLRSHGDATPCYARLRAASYRIAGIALRHLATRSDISPRAAAHRIIDLRKIKMELPIQTPLYELVAEYAEVTRALEDLDIDEQTVYDTLEGLALPLEQKITQVSAYILNIEATRDAILVRAAEMRDRAARIEARAGKLREYLKSNMERAGISRISSPEFEITIRTNPPCVVVDVEAAIPAAFWREPKPQPLEVNKQAILDEFRQGREVEGCHAEKRTRLEIK